ncbi:MAG: peptidoglycan LD-endopeptidase LytH [Sphingomonadales bacterium]|jgi:murein DD-endopeptidase MepM/ murein hydrolase activator NlpD|nr:peptidoglycan LD-endopeptidase LytH [Sphingomonadales bacterium]
MDRLKLILVIVATAVVTAALTSAFWLTAFNRGRLAEAPAGPRSAPSAAPAAAIPPAQLVRGPTGLAIPVVGVKAEQLTDTYTAARANGRSHDATDIMAPRGTLVVAAAPGTLEKLFFSKGGGGITAYVRSPDRAWQYYYAHLDAYAPGLHEGQAVKQGDPIGRVGSTGDASPNAPHLHFAINRMGQSERWWQGTPINPYPLLGGKH